MVVGSDAPSSVAIGGAETFGSMSVLGVVKGW